MTKLLSSLWQMLLGACLWLASAGPVEAQREYFNWHFGQSAAVTFVAPVPQAAVLSTGQITFPQGAASISDGAGAFQFDSDGYRVWDRTGRPMPGANVVQTLKNYANNTRQVLVLPAPGSPSRYYVFVSQREYYPNEYPVSSTTALYLPYVVVDMSLRGGLGGIASHDSLRLPNAALGIQAPIFGLAGNWAAVRHANGRDLWLVGVSSEGQYLSWLLNATGLARTPVMSNVPRWINFGTSIFKASPDGHTLALLANARDNQAFGNRIVGRLELAGFDAATGQVSNGQELPTRFKGSGWFVSGNNAGGLLSRLVGLEFSPDGSRLYVDSAGTYPLQYNLLAGTRQAIDASRTPIQPIASGSRLPSSLTDMKLAPDGRIYIIYAGSSSVSCITTPNALGQACQLQAGVLNLQARSAGSGTLPLSVNDLNLPPVVVSSAGSIAAGSGCAGSLIQFMSSLSPFVTAASYAWDFGDPASGTLNASAGQAPGHVYQQGGTYTVTLRITSISGQQYTATQMVQVYNRPAVNLGPARTVCADEAVHLSAGSQPAGSTYLWQDGSTAPEREITASGTYRLTISSPNGCLATAEVDITVSDCPALPNIITPNGDALNQAFVLKGLNAPDWTLRLYNRWGREVFWQEHYDNSWAAQGQPDGVYFYLLTNPATGQKYKGWVEVIR